LLLEVAEEVIHVEVMEHFTQPLEDKDQTETLGFGVGVELVDKMITLVQ
jgi:hypothetical protein